jgi:AhpD family alkylhydroperoxidase
MGGGHVTLGEPFEKGDPVTDQGIDPIIPLDDRPEEPHVRDIYARFESTLGFVPNLVKLWSRAPYLVAALVGLETALGAEGRVPLAMKELAMTRTSELNGCPYCRAFHRARLRQLGVDRDKSASLGAPALPRELFTEEELAVLALADEMTLDVKAKPETVRCVTALYGAAGAVELMAVVALLNFDNRMAFSAELPPDPVTLVSSSDRR